MSFKLPWYSQRTPSEPPAAAAAAPPDAPDPLSAQVSHLTAEIAGLRLEWSETLDKLGRWASRQSARDRRRVDRDLDGLASGDADSSHEDAPGATNGGGATSGSLPTKAALRAALRRRIHNGESQ